MMPDLRLLLYYTYHYAIEFAFFTYHADTAPRHFISLISSMLLISSLFTFSDYALRRLFAAYMPDAAPLPRRHDAATLDCSRALFFATCFLHSYGAR